MKVFGVLADIYKNTLKKMEKELPIDKIPNRRVSIFTPGWEISVGVKTTDLSQLILKEWKKKKHELWRMKKAVEELKPSTTPRIIRIWNKVQQIRKKINSDQTTFLNTFYKHHTRLKVQRLKYKIKYSKSNWSKSIAIRKLSKLKLQCNKKSAPEANDVSRHSSKASYQIQCDRRSAREADDTSRQASKASSQRSSPNIERDNIKRKEGCKATSQLQHVGILRRSSCKLLNWLENGHVVATGEIESTNPEVKVHHMVLGPDCWKVWVTVVRVENISLYRPTSEFRVLEDVISSTIAWPSKYVRVGE